MQSAYDDVKAALRIYYDIPAMIADEWDQIRNCEAQREKIGTVAAELRQTVEEGGVDSSGNRTAQLAAEDQKCIFQDEIDDRHAQIADLRRKREWIRSALTKVERDDLRILELAYMGPTSPQERENFRGLTATKIGPIVGVSPRHVRRIANKLLKQIKEDKEEKLC
jgi:DNA-directed RNA polymerase specialized sigma subunit